MKRTFWNIISLLGIIAIVLDWIGIYYLHKSDLVFSTNGLIIIGFFTVFAEIFYLEEKYNLNKTMQVRKE